MEVELLNWKQAAGGLWCLLVVFVALLMEVEGRVGEEM